MKRRNFFRWVGSLLFAPCAIWMARRSLQAQKSFPSRQFRYEKLVSGGVELVISEGIGFVATHRNLIADHIEVVAGYEAVISGSWAEIGKEPGIPVGRSEIKTMRFETYSSPCPAGVPTVVRRTVVDDIDKLRIIRVILLKEIATEEFR